MARCIEKTKNISDLLRFIRKNRGIIKIKVLSRMCERGENLVHVKMDWEYMERSYGHSSQTLGFNHVFLVSPHYHNEVSFLNYGGFRLVKVTNAFGYFVLCAPRFHFKKAINFLKKDNDLEFSISTYEKYKMNVDTRSEAFREDMDQKTKGVNNDRKHTTIFMRGLDDCRDVNRDSDGGLK